MDLQTVEIPRWEARQAALEYQREARAQSGERAREFAEIARAYRLAARDGVPLIALTPTIRAAGTVVRTVVYGKGTRWERRENYLLPRLAVCRASAAFVYTRGVQGDGSVEFVDSLRRRFDYRSGRVKLEAAFAAGSDSAIGRDLVGSGDRSAWSSMVPVVPPKHRPRSGSSLGSYLVLWEVDEWTWSTVPPPPGDPALLRHVGGDIYAVVATWNLTELERLVLSGRRQDPFE